MEQLNTPVAQYSVSYSIDGGKEWIAGPAECARVRVRVRVRARVRVRVRLCTI